MDNVKPWQIILFTVAILALAFSAWKFKSGAKIDLPDSVLVVDVESGDLYRMKLGKRNGAYFPERNPETKKLTLMPVVRNDDGEWHIVGHARAALQDINGTNNVVDEATWRVDIDSDKVLKTLKAGG